MFIKIFSVVVAVNFATVFMISVYDSTIFMFISDLGSSFHDILFAAFRRGDDGGSQ